VLLGLLRAHVPEGTREQIVELGAEGPGAEIALLDYWTDLSEAERSCVWAVTGALAGALVRFRNEPLLPFAFVGAGSARRPANAQSRSLLMAARADTWALALDGDVPADAAGWSESLSSVVSHVWRLGVAGDVVSMLSSAREALALHGSGGERLPPLTLAIEEPPRPGPGWLDEELHARLPVTCAGAPRAEATLSAADPDPADAAERVLRGRHGRLFLVHDSHDSHRQMIGERPLDARELDAWAHGTSARYDRLRARGARFVHLIGPAPQVVHAADLPVGTTISAGRPVRQILERLERERIEAPMLYPLAALEAVRSAGDPFSLTDSHWNDLGAFVGYEAVLAQLGNDVPMRRVGRDEVSFQDTAYVGDLGGKLRPARASIFLRARLDRPQARVVEDNRVRNHGRRVVYECAAAPAGTCLVFGDSWAYPMMLFLAETFRRCVFFHRVNVIDRRPIEQERPDVVLVVLTERFCTAVPGDEGAADFDALAAKKIRKGDVVPESAAGERHSFLFSLALDRGLAAGPGLRLPRLAPASSAGVSR
jgi:hypothetical protein